MQKYKEIIIPLEIKLDHHTLPEPKRSTHNALKAASICDLMAKNTEDYDYSKIHDDRYKFYFILEGSAFCGWRAGFTYKIISELFDCHDIYNSIARLVNYWTSIDKVTMYMPIEEKEQECSHAK